jgi:murein DD-endopeptidase MepM/ murein hydrolase activator NlpD
VNSKLGVHVTTGPRNGYGPVARAKPKIVIAVNEGGALTETSSPTITIYRDTTVFGDAPPGIDETNEEGARALAGSYYPQLKARWLMNPATYYQPTNEYGGNNLAALKKLVAFESRLVELAAADNIALCVGSFAGGSPGDLEVWKTICVPLILLAWQNGGIYGRHAYGPGLLTKPDAEPTDGNSGRPFVEAAYLQTLGVSGGMVITEAGQNAGFTFPGVDAFMEDAARYDVLMQPYPVIIGCCLWTYGDYLMANMQAASEKLAEYLEANPVEAWRRPQPTPLPDLIPETNGSKIVTAREVNLRSAPRPLSETMLATIRAGTVLEKIGELNGDEIAGNDNWIQAAAYLHETFVNQLDAEQERVITTRQVNLRTAPHLIDGTVLARLGAGHVLERIGEVTGDGFAGSTNWVKVAVYIDLNFVDSVAMAERFRFTHWPTTARVITQRFGENPTYFFTRFRLPGHEGVDIRAPLGTDVFSVADGTVSDIHAADDGHSYGIFVRIRHGSSGYETTYAHLQEVTIQLNQNVKGGDLIGKADNTGNIISGDSHLHLTLKHDDAVPGKAKYAGYPHKIVDPTPFLLPLLQNLIPTEGDVDLLPYMLADRPDNVLYEVQTLGGGQQRHQTQLASNKFFHTKDEEWEELWSDDFYIYRGTDTSPGNGEYYTLRDGAVYGSKWAKRRMAVGETFERNPMVIHFRKNDCQELRRGNHRSWLKLVAVYPSYTFFTGITLPDVIEMAWLGSLAGEPLEIYFYSKSYGLVGWKSHDGRQSAISEIHAPEARPDNLREGIPCLRTD